MCPLDVDQPTPSLNSKNHSLLPQQYTVYNTDMTTAFFLRHGPTKENKEGRIQGQQPGTVLVSDTERYMAAVVPLLRENNPEVLLSSDLVRAEATRTVLKNFLQLPLVAEEVTPLLREKAMGFYEGMLWEDVPEAFSEQRGLNFYNFRPFGGESNEDVRGRVRTFLQHLPRQYPNSRVCCITHAGWIAQLVVLADMEGVLPDGWSNRTAIYVADVGLDGKLVNFHPIAIEAELPDED